MVPKMETNFPEIGDLDFGPYRPGEEDAVLNCFAACFGRQQSKEAWRHIYLDNPAGQTIVILARHQGAVASQAAIHLRRINAFGQKGAAGLGSWAMTRQPWRHKGLSRTLLNEAHEKSLNQGTLLIYGFPNDNLIWNVCKYQFHRIVSPLPVMIRPVRPIRNVFSKSAGKFLGSQGFDFSEIKPLGWKKPEFDYRHTQLFRDAEAIPPISVLRDLTYLNWRYQTWPGSTFLQRDIVREDVVVATIILRPSVEFGKRIVIVMEWFWRRGSRPEGLRLMWEAFRFARVAGAHGLSALAMPGTLQRRLLWLLGFIRLPLRFLPEFSTLTVRPNCEISDDAQRWVIPSNWYLTFGDGNTL
jgi:hypothetical protein